MSASMGALLDEVVAAARELPSASMAKLVALLEDAVALTEPVERALLAAVVQPASQDLVRRILRRWRAAGLAVPPVALAWALRSASASDAWRREHERIDLVWTGPPTLSQGVFRTQATLLDVVRGARRSLLMVTFAAYRIEVVRRALREAADRGVDVVLVIETDEGRAGKIEHNPLEELIAEPLGIRAMEWPVAERPRDGERYGALHAKCAPADDEVLFVSSANLTGNALELNMELGVLIRGGPVPAQAGRHFRELMLRGILRAIE